ncbi:hypothetical protein HY416_02145 [Candidatus Kaiserbacteria bacterium]|nr:hypothetical protein [Candidatus Kaiserbacteria bacterium]
MHIPCLMVAAGKVKTVEDIRYFAESDVIDEITAGSFTRHARSGNEEPTFVEIEPGTYLNASGLPNGGFSYLERNISGMIEAAGIKRLRISIAPVEPGDLSVMTSFLRDYPITLEVNTSCPNVWQDDKQKPLLCHDRGAFERALAEVAAARGSLRVAVKVSPLSDDLREEIIRLCQTYKIDEFITMNTRPKVSTLRDGTQLLSVPFAGMSGTAIAEEALGEVRKAQEILKKLNISILLVGVGGINSSDMVQRMCAAGVDAVQVGSYAFVHGPEVFKRLYAT